MDRDGGQGRLGVVSEESLRVCGLILTGLGSADVTKHALCSDPVKPDGPVPRLFSDVPRQVATMAGAPPAVRSLGKGILAALGS